MFWKNKKINYWTKKIDKIVTWLIIWSALASIFWLANTKKWKEFSNDIKINSSSIIKKFSIKTIWIIWKILAFVTWIFSKKKLWKK